MLSTMSLVAEGALRFTSSRKQALVCGKETPGSARAECSRTPGETAPLGRRPADIDRFGARVGDSARLSSNPERIIPCRTSKPP